MSASRAAHREHDTIASPPGVPLHTIGGYRSVPATYLVRERIHWHAKRPRQTEITKLQLTLAIDQKVLGLEVAMEDSVLMAEGSAFKQLVHETTHSHGVKGTVLAMRVHVLLKILFTILEDEDKLGLRVDDIVQPDNVGVLELLHEGYFTDGGRGSALFGIEVNFLEGNDFVGGSRSALGARECGVAWPACRNTPCRR